LKNFSSTRALSSLASSPRCCRNRLSLPTICICRVAVDGAYPNILS
jgi:hypothetical protein